MKKFKKIIFLLILFALAPLVACGGTNNPPVEPDGGGQSQGDGGGGSQTVDPPKETPRFKEDYTPTLFSNATYEEKELVEGLTLFTYTVTKANGQICVIRCLEADLKKVDIKAGTKDNVSIGFDYSKTTPYAAGLAYKEATGKDVYATLNADFFGGSLCVNAFVKDGFIVKASHNDNNNYDYLNSSSDVPASAPMLFGVKGVTAQVAPIIKYEGDITSVPVKKPVIRASLNYVITAGIKTMETSSSFKIVNTTLYLNSGDMYAILDVSKGASNIEVLEINVATKQTTLNPLDSDKAYLYCASTNSDAASFLNRIAAGEKISLSVASPDATWDGYETILGCRQALVIDGKVADTVKLENTNGAQYGEVPRSAVGVNVDGIVCIYAVESLYYGSKASDGDSHGCDLNMLAEFMMYNNVINGANFDGGGSTQLVCKVDGVDQVLVRSSDTGSTGLTNTRLVMNVIMVTEK